MPTNSIYIQRLLQTIAILHVMVGLCFPWIVDSPLFDHYKQHLYLAFNTSEEYSGQQTSFLIAIFGPTIASWGVLFLYAVNSGFARPSPQAWWFMFAACLVWAPYDSIFSLQYGIYLNAIINAVAFVMMTTPLLLVRKRFFATNPGE
jgi:hypothetical protein